VERNKLISFCSVWIVFCIFMIPLLVSCREYSVDFISFLLSLVGVLVIAVSIVLVVTYRHWMNTWEGLVIRKYTYETTGTKGGTATHYAVELNPPIGMVTRVTLSYSDWNRVEVGDYIVKKSRSYTIKIRRGEI